MCQFFTPTSDYRSVCMHAEVCYVCMQAMNRQPMSTHSPHVSHGADDPLRVDPRMASVDSAVELPGLRLYGTSV